VVSLILACPTVESNNVKGPHHKRATDEQIAFVKGQPSSKITLDGAGGDDKWTRITFPKMGRTDSLEVEKVQYDCVADVPVGTDWTEAGSCPQDDDGDCCKEGDAKSQLVGLLLQFFAGFLGAGYFYYGYYGIGVLFTVAGISICALSICLQSGSISDVLKNDGIEKAFKQNYTERCGLMVVLCTCCLFYLVVFASWLAMITKGVLPGDGCPLDCNL